MNYFLCISQIQMKWTLLMKSLPVYIIYIYCTYCVLIFLCWSYPSSVCVRENRGIVVLYNLYYIKYCLSIQKAKQASSYKDQAVVITHLLFQD